MSARKAAITLFSSSTCSLCTNAREAILRVQKKTPFGLTVLDIHEEECPIEFHDKYMFDVPVLHLNGKFLMQHRVPEDSLLEAIKLYEATGKINPKY
ncbi:putative glutaredoxin [Helicostylum pulchrum]|uniref:Glutaredoxin-like protein n=1 Tax=Helicostylum pulchrum TaxID=562976 RepID=A0ABP9YFD5_9FUNG|nr:putative glutaredoxin [Helicostylum pulchrum]